MSYLPFGYLRDFLGLLARRNDLFETLTYRDLDWNDDWDCAGGYPAERAAWKASLRNGRRDPGKVYLFIQHDVDSAPERTMAALQVEEALGLRSNVMIFNRRVDRRLLRDTGKLEFTPYIDDFSYLKSLEDKGFVIGYHCNAYECASFSRPHAEQIMLEDVAELGRHVRIDFMSAHGGPGGPDGKSNSSLALPDALKREVRWVHNGYSVYVDGSYSDGGINMSRRERDPDEFDLRRFVRSLRRGCRYRILLHPQYYGDSVRVNPRLKSAWYGDVLAAYERSPGRNAWGGDEEYGIERFRFMVDAPAAARRISRLLGRWARRALNG